MSISSIGIQTVTANTGTGARQQAASQQQSAANDNGSDAPPAMTGGSSASHTTGKHVDKMA